MKPICLTNDTLPTKENTWRKGVKGRKDMERHGKMTKGAEAAETSSSNRWDPLRSSPSRHLHRSTALVPREGPQPKPRHGDGRGCVSSIWYSSEWTELWYYNDHMIFYNLARATRRVTSHWWPWSTRTAWGRFVWMPSRLTCYRAWVWSNEMLNECRAQRAPGTFCKTNHSRNSIASVARIDHTAMEPSE